MDPADATTVFVSLWQNNLRRAARRVVHHLAEGDRGLLPLRQRRDLHGPGRPADGGRAAPTVAATKTTARKDR